jgi:hypothetical protein
VSRRVIVEPLRVPLQLVEQKPISRVRLAAVDASDMRGGLGALDVIAARIDLVDQMYRELSGYFNRTVKGEIRRLMGFAVLSD